MVEKLLERMKLRVSLGTREDTMSYRKREKSDLAFSGN